jgi:hypothetical protein
MPRQKAAVQRELSPPIPELRVGAIFAAVTVRAYASRGERGSRPRTIGHPGAAISACPSTTSRLPQPPPVQRSRGSPEGRAERRANAQSELVAPHGVAHPNLLGTAGRACARSPRSGGRARSGRGRRCEDPFQVRQIQRDIAEPATPSQCRRSSTHEHVVARAILACWHGSEARFSLVCEHITRPIHTPPGVCP